MASLYQVPISVRLLHVGLTSIPWLAAEERDGWRGKPKGRGVFHIACIWGDIATALSTASFMQLHYSFTTLLLFNLVPLSMR